MEKQNKPQKGFINPRLVKAISFYTITTCIIFSVVMCILAIWEYAEPDIFWRTVATLGVIGVGTAVFAYVNGIFGSEPM
jgi:hypothetical protein